MYVWWEGVERVSVSVSVIDVLLLQLLNICVVQAVFGWAIKRIAHWIAMYGEPLPLPPSRPRNYSPGDWLQ